MQWKDVWYLVSIWCSIPIYVYDVGSQYVDHGWINYHWSVWAWDGLWRCIVAHYKYKSRGHMCNYWSGNIKAQYILCEAFFFVFPNTIVLNVKQEEKCCLK